MQAMLPRTYACRRDTRARDGRRRSAPLDHMPAATITPGAAFVAAAAYKRTSQEGES